jgi:hypothetical protein
VNAWLQPLGLHAHDDAVLRARRHPRYPHPKEVFLTLPTQEGEREEEGGEEGGKGFSFVYPYGCSLSVQPPAKVGREGGREEGREGGRAKPQNCVRFLVQIIWAHLYLSA